jgi:hypothetical protein
MGQVSIESAFGQAIRKVCLEDDVNICVDIGAWDGQGTTKCIVDALQTKGKGHVFSYEINDDMHEKARTFWEGNSYITLSKSRLAESMVTIDWVVSQKEFSNIKDSDWMSWFKGEERDFSKSVLSKAPSKIDFVVIDGGEFSGPGDWEAVKNAQPKYVALDDTHSVKTPTIYRQLTSSGEYIVHAIGSDRNGWVILMKS